jgi:hypothetical protein
MQHSIKEQRSPFLERWSTAEAINGKLMVSIVILTLLCGVLVMALIQTVLQPRPIYYIPSIREAGIAYPQSIPENAVSVFTVSWVLNWTNFTPVTVDEAYSRAQKFMSPKLLSKTQARLKNDILQVKSNSMSSLFSISGDPILSKDNKFYKVSITGEKGVFVGKEAVSTQNITYRITLKKVNPTDANPYGLMIDELDQDINGGQI